MIRSPKVNLHSDITKTAPLSPSNQRKAISVGDIVLVCSAPGAGGKEWRYHRFQIGLLFQIGHSIERGVESMKVR